MLDKNLVSRSVFLAKWTDDALRRIAHQQGVTKNHLIRCMVVAKLDHWEHDASNMKMDIMMGGRSTP